MEELRNTIITEVKQSEILNQDDSENLKLRQLSDSIYQELGKKIMGQISDEVWKVIRNESTKNNISGTVESVYDRIVNPKPEEENAEEASTLDESEPKMPPGFAPPDLHHELLPSLPSEEELHSATNMVEDEDMPPGFGIPSINNDGGGADLPPGFELGVDAGVDMPPGFSTPRFVGAGVCDDDGDDLDVPPGFG